MVALKLKLAFAKVALALLYFLLLPLTSSSVDSLVFFPMFVNVHMQMTLLRLLILSPLTPRSSCILFANMALSLVCIFTSTKLLSSPLFDAPHEDIRDPMAIYDVDRIQVSFNDSTVYLGFLLGPGKGNKGWDRAISKCITSVTRWREAGLSFFFTPPISTMCFYSLLSSSLPNLKNLLTHLIQLECRP